MATGTTSVDIAGLAGNEAAQPRVFAHSAYEIPTPASTGSENTYPVPADDTAAAFNATFFKRCFNSVHGSKPSLIFVTL